MEVPWAPSWRSPGLRLPEFALAMGLGQGGTALWGRGYPGLVQCAVLSTQHMWAQMSGVDGS